MKYVGFFFLLESYMQKVDCRVSKKVLQHIHFVLTNTSHWRFREKKKNSAWNIKIWEQSISNIEAKF